MVIVIRDGVCEDDELSGGGVADGMNPRSGPQSGHCLYARTLRNTREKRRDEMIMLRALVRGCIYNKARVVYLQALVQHSKIEFGVVKIPSGFYGFRRIPLIPAGFCQNAWERVKSSMYFKI
jgi:hypothetical protein